MILNTFGGACYPFQQTNQHRAGPAVPLCKRLSAGAIAHWYRRTRRHILRDNVDDSLLIVIVIYIYSNSFLFNIYNNVGRDYHEIIVTN